MARYNTCVVSLGVLHVYKYKCITCVADTCVIHMFYMCNTCVGYTAYYTCNSTHVIHV